MWSKSIMNKIFINPDKKYGEQRFWYLEILSSGRVVPCL